MNKIQQNSKASNSLAEGSLALRFAQQVNTSLKNWRQTAKSGDVVFLAEALNYRGELSNALQKIIVQSRKTALLWEHVALACSILLTLVCLMMGMLQVTMPAGLISDPLLAAGLFCGALLVSWLPWLIGSVRARRIRYKNGNFACLHAALRLYDQTVIQEFLKETE